LSLQIHLLLNILLLHQQNLQKTKEAFVLHLF